MLKINHKKLDDKFINAMQEAMLQLLPLLRFADKGEHQLAVKKVLVHLLNKAEEAMEEEKVGVIAGRCSEKHGDKTFQEFLDMGGDKCPICLQNKLNNAKKTMMSMSEAQGRRIMLLTECLKRAESQLASKNTK